MSDDPEWPVVSTRTEHETPWFTVGSDLVERPDGERARYYWVDPGDAVSVVARDGDDVVLVEQYRPRYRERALEVPMGGVETGESFTEAARRELREETGYRAGTAELLDTFDGEAWLRRERGVVLAADLEAGDRDLDDGEFIAVRRVPAAEAVERVRSGPHRPGTLAALLLARDEGLL